MEFKKGSWTVEEDSKLINYINIHGEGSWNSVAQCSGLNRTGKSCRLRWLNYLRPDVRRGNLTLQEQFLILHLHCCWGNRWSKIARQLPGRTDNEIKNYWRTRIQKQANQMKCDVNSNEFRDTIRFLLLPRLVDQIQASASSTAEPTTSTTTTTGTGTISIHDNSPTYYMTEIVTTTTTTPDGYIVITDHPTSENETETSMASSHTHLLEDHLVFPDVTDFTDCDDDVIVMANNWPVGFTDGLVSGPTFASSSAFCEQDRFDGSQALDYYGNAWLGQ